MRLQTGIAFLIGLRDIPEQLGFSLNITWPKMPD
jgi:hypothetical protein